MANSRPTIVDLNHVEGTPLPASERVFYQCLRCWSILRSSPSDNENCTCGNVAADVDAGRAGATDEKLLRVLQIGSAE
jgi:hypothetical protein